MRVVIFLLGLIFVSCSQKQIILNTQNQKDYLVFLDAPLVEDNIKLYTSINKFPFISSKICDVKNYNIKAINISKVNDYNICDYKIIYIKDIYIKDFKIVSNNLIENIAHSYNLNPLKFKKWIKDGGIIWFQGAIYVTGYEFFNITPNFKKSISYLLNKTKNMKINNIALPQELLTTKTEDIVNYKKIIKNYLNNSLHLKKDFFAGIYFLKKSLPYKIYRIGNGAFVVIRDYNVCEKYSRDIRIDAYDKAVGEYVIKGFVIKDKISDLMLLNLKLMGKYLQYKPFKKIFIYTSNNLIFYAKKIKQYLSQYTNNIEIIVNKKNVNEIKFGFKNE